MPSTFKFQMEDRHYKIVKDILEREQLTAFIFGSRAKGTAKKFSDLDLVIKTAVDSKQLSRLRSDFEESKLPYKVDIIVWSDIDEAFKKHIQSDLKVF